MYSQTKITSESNSIFSKIQRKIFYFFTVFICTVSLFCISGCSKGEPVEKYSKRLETKLNNELNNPNHSVRKRVESAHVTVDVTKAYVTKIDITTKDGSDNAGEDGSNISQIRVNIMTRWDGIFHKNGYTEFYVVYDMTSGQAEEKDAGIVKTNATIVNGSTEFWLSVASCLILLI